MDAAGRRKRGNTGEGFTEGHTGECEVPDFSKGEAARGREVGETEDGKEIKVVWLVVG